MFKIKHLSYLLIFILAPGFFNSCKEQNDSEDSLFSTMNLTLLSYVQEQMSGQCTVVNRNEESSGGFRYTAHGYNIPKAFCNPETVGPTVTSDASVALAMIHEYFDKVIEGYQNYDACSARATTITESKNSFNEEMLETTRGSSNCLSYFLGAKSIYYCKDTSGSVIKHQFVEDVVSDMNHGFEFRKTDLKANQATNKFSDTAISNARMTTSEEQNIERSPDFMAYFIYTTDTECQKAILEGNPDVRALILTQFGANEAQGLTEAEASPLTETIISSFSNPLICHYGAGEPYSTSIGLCPSSYPLF